MTLNFEVRGSGTPLICLHGFPLDHRSLLSLDGALGSVPGWARYYVDLPGFGESAGEGIDSSLAVADAVAAFIREELGDQSFALLGHSFGGMISRYLAGVFGGQVLGVAMLAPVAVADAERRQRPEHRVLVTADGWIEKIPDEQRQSFEENCIFHTPEMWVAYRDGVLPGLSAGDPAAVNRINAHYALPSEPEQQFGPFVQPSLMVLGRLDSSVGYLDQLALSESYPSATIALLDRAGHMPFWEQPELVASMLRDWLERVGNDRVRNDRADSGGAHE